MQKMGEVLNRLLLINFLGETACGAELYSIVMNPIFKGKENIIGLFSYKGSKISEKNKGLTNRINQKLPRVLVVRSFSDLFNLVSNYSIKKFPSGPVFFIKAISGHFRYFL